MIIKFRQSFLIFILSISGLFNLSAQEVYNTYYTNVSSNVFLSYPNLNNKINILDLDIDYLNATIFHLTNNERANAQLPLFEFYNNLYKSAVLHSESMIHYDYFNHENHIQKKWRTPSDRIFYFDESYRSLAENILENNLLDYKGSKLTYRTDINSDGKLIYLDPNGNEIQYASYLILAQKLVLQWMNSPGHRANILNKNFSLLGCACAINQNKVPVLIRCTQNFGRIN